METIDKTPDPRPSTQYTPRQRGEPKEQPLLSTKSFEGRARRWMVNPEWLTEHPESNTDDRVADNGRAWGDSQDPEEIIAARQYVKEEKLSGKRKRTQSTRIEVTPAVPAVDGKDMRKRRELALARRGEGTAEEFAVAAQALAIGVDGVLEGDAEVWD